MPQFSLLDVELATMFQGYEFFIELCKYFRNYFCLHSNFFNDEVFHF